MRLWIGLLVGVVACGGGGDVSEDDGGGGAATSVSSSGGSAAGGQGGAPGIDFSAVEAALQASDLEDCGLIIGNLDGELYRTTKGAFTLNQPVRTASAAKWLSSAVVLQLVEEGVLALEDRPQDHLSWWTSTEDDLRRDITIRQLLAFTSGFDGTPAGPGAVDCVSDPATTLDACARAIHDDANRFVFDPGTNFFYGPSHMQILGAIAEAATGQTWSDIVSSRVTIPLGMSGTAYGRPSAANPRISAGADTTAEDYARFLLAMSRSGFGAFDARWPTTFGDLVADNTPSGSVTLASTPIDAYGYEWHYGLGVWRECIQPAWTTECDALAVVSSTGAFGFHPWLDTRTGVWGVIAIESLTVSPPPALRSVEVALELRPLIDAALAAAP
ncbi:MAG: serine hydrolase domain-containing protein [Myxococcota bacterium]